MARNRERSARQILAAYDTPYGHTMWHYLCIILALCTVSQPAQSRHRDTITILNSTNRALYIACYAEGGRRPAYSIAIPKHKKSSINRPEDQTQRWYIVGALSLHALPAAHTPHKTNGMLIQPSTQTIICSLEKNKLIFAPLQRE